MPGEKYRPQTRADWEALHADITESFSPGAPIKERDLFSGRREQIDKLVDAVRQAGKHAIIYGERGVGKTSLSNTFALALHSPTRSLVAEKINADSRDSFTTLWKKVFKRLSYKVEEGGELFSKRVSDDYDGVISPDDIEIELGNFSKSTIPIIIIDEFDRIQDEAVPLLMSDTIKALSDRPVSCTLVIVGVAENISTLIKDHESISRQLIQVQMPRMKREELAKIIIDRLTRSGMGINEETLWRITYLSRGLPYFTHLLGMHSARAAVAERRLTIRDEHLTKGIESSLAEVDLSLRAKYADAVISKKPKETLFESVLLACALAEADDLGRFSQKSVEEPLAAITPGKQYRATTYAFHMNEFTGEGRGAVLEVYGERQNPRYRFRDPMMQPYVILRGLAEGRIDNTINERFTPARQPLLAIDNERPFEDAADDTGG